ncbi:hypothetical protein ELG77_08830 [Rhizobium leguminosarum]|uniref:hypothetical protein n=1 Tax=Rhizobium leguminosarum TaxID=384 RepID=UPI00103130D1|nr:hypothetical protein [Rhizobium leguminosarum]TBG41867.1 hypothetical protein ELG77_08830 [Rhizobium leguminosarum]
MERPILLKAHEVRGILDGRQSQLRRICKQVNADFWLENTRLNDDLRAEALKAIIENCPFGQVGDRLWGRETWEVCPHGYGAGKDSFDIRYRADGATIFHDLDADSERANHLTHIYDTRPENLPSTQMPRWASRILLEIVSVRVERLQDISDMDAVAQGCKAVRDHCHVFEGSGYDKAGLCHGTPKIAFGCRWDEIHGSESWVENPWVWVVEFKRVDAS